MNIVGIKLHSILDYFIASFLVVSPWILGFANSDSAQNVPMIIGGSMLVYSIFTKYDLGVIKLLHVRLHLALDLFAGFILVCSPLLFDFSDYAVFPHVLSGLLITTLSLITDTPARNHGARMMNFRKSFWGEPK